MSVPEGQLRPEAQTAAGRGPQLELGDFSGPLDLLYFLIESQKIDIYDIPIASITAQYMAYLSGLDSLDMDLASDFLVMAASLLDIKSRMLLPRKCDEEVEDPRQDLVLKLLEYRRCKLIAERLRREEELIAGSRRRLPSTAQDLGIVLERVPEQEEQSCRPERFWRAAQAVERRNGLRFQDLSERLQHILRRERVSLRSKLRQIWRKLCERGSFYFSELFPYASSRAERVTGFLALLELLRGGRIEAEQRDNFSAIKLSLAAGQEEGSQAFSDWLEKTYREQEGDYEQ